MSIVPASLSRVPELMLMRTSLLRLNRTNVDLFNVQTQLSTGYRINRPSDDIVRTAAISILDDRLERSDQRLRNLDHAGLALDVLDSALGEASDLVLEAKSIASNQSNIGASAEERSLQSEVVDSLIQSLANIANRKSIAGYAFGGSSAGRQPIVEHMGGYRYVGEGGGLFTDNGLGSTVPITIGGANPIGELSARHSGNVDLDPALTGDTRLSDLNGARAMGVTLGVVEFSFEDGPHVEVDLTEASTVADVADALEAALKQHEVDTGQQILGPDGVSWQGGSFTFDIVNAPAGLPQPTLQFFDIAQGVTALDLGLTIPGGSVINGSSPPGPDVNARVTWRTPVGAMEGLSGALGSIRLTNMGQSQIIDLSGAETLGDVRNAIENSGLGVRVEINADATGIDVFNEVAGGREQAMSISEVGPSSQTAAALGIRTFSAATSIADFNDGEGVQIVTGSTDPETGAPDPSGDVDFIITIGDGTEIPVNLRPQDIVSVQTVIDRINAEAANAGVSVPATFQATVSALSNGIQLRQNGNLPNPISVTPDNNSPAPYQLGLMDATSSGNGASLTSSDRAKVRIDNLFTHLIDLRDSLKEDSTIGIDFAAQRIEASVDRVAQTRALVGGFANRVQSEQRRQEDLSVLEQKTRSDLRDLDYAEAAVRFSLLQTQLQAAMQAIQVSQSATLLDFLAL